MNYKRLSIFVTLAMLAGLVSMGGGLAHATTSYTPTGFYRDNINMTALLINPGNVVGEVDATGCNIGVYYGAGATGTVNVADIFGANYFGVVNDGADINISNSDIHDIGEAPLNG